MRNRTSSGAACLSRTPRWPVVLALLLLCASLAPLPAPAASPAAQRRTPTATRTVRPSPTPRRTPEPTRPQSALAARVGAVIDGATIRVTIAGRTQTVRYIGIDAPSADAVAANRALVSGATVYLEQDVSEADENGHLLRHVWVGGWLAGAELVRQGLAQARPAPPDVRYRTYLADLEREARAARRGRWAAGATPTADGCTPGLVYESDVTIPDGTVLRPGAAFTKTWSVRNAGGCAWGEGFALRQVGGDDMRAAAAVPVAPAAPGETAEVSARLTAPDAPGRYAGVWQLCGPAECYPQRLTVVIVTEAAARSSAPVRSSALPTAPAVRAGPRAECDPSYPSVCIPPRPPDLNCPDIPHRDFTVLSPDPHGFDRDKDGIGCESQ